MKKEPWDEEQIESYFKQAPKVTDHRTKDEVFKRLVDEGAFNEQSPQKENVPQRGIRWMPLIASIASLFILVLIGSQFIGNKSISMDNSAMDQKAFKGEDKAESTSIEDAAGRSMIEKFSMDVQAPQTLVYESQLVMRMTDEVRSYRGRCKGIKSKDRYGVT